MTKIIITLLVVGLLGVFIPKIYYHYKEVPTPIIVIQPVLEEPKVVNEVKKKITSNKIVIPVVTPEVKEYIDNIFGENAKVATAVLMHESGLRLDAKGWNCIYDGRSKACDVEDRHLAVSVDCGIVQKNVKGKVCPAELMTLEGNMKAAEEVYKAQGLNAWVSYSTGRYKPFLEHTI